MEHKQRKLEKKVDPMVLSYKPSAREGGAGDKEFSVILRYTPSVGNLHGLPMTCLKNQQKTRKEQKPRSAAPPYCCQCT